MTDRSSRGRLSIDPDIAEAFSEYRAYVLYAEGIENGPSDEDSAALLNEAVVRQRARFDGQKATSHPHIAAWREAFSAFGSKPSRYPCSAEALLTRVLKGNEAPAVNYLVDLYNAVSIEHVIPIGGEDWDRLASDSHLRFARGDEPFITFHGEEEDLTNPDPGEVVWADAEGVTCRRWNWRQCHRTRLTEESTAAYFLLEAMGGFDPAELKAGAERLGELIREKSPGVTIQTARLGS